MKEIFSNISHYYTEINKRVLATTTLLTGLMIYINFFFGVDKWIDSQGSVVASFFYQYLIFLTAFALPYLFYYVFTGKNYFNKPFFIFLVFLSPALFSWKMAMPTQTMLTNDYLWDYYWNQIIYWPVRLLVLALMLFVLWRLFYRNETFFGFTANNFKWKPYLLMLVIMVPLVAAASTQPDFLAMYPKLGDVETVLTGRESNWFYKLLYELSYGTDFISVELFFRGFLVLAFVKIAGKDAILPMACYYCTIHFGKPLGECISSYFGGMLLGIVVYHTRSIFGGLAVHLGIAWLMELGGYIGNELK
jgi:hypothetical protein